MSQFYARYEPPSSKTTATLPRPTNGTNAQPTGKVEPAGQPKRKRDHDSEPSVKDHKRRKSGNILQIHRSNGDSGKEATMKVSASKSTATEGSDVLDKYSISKAARDTEVDIEVRAPKEKRAEIAKDSPPTPANLEAEKTRKRDKKETTKAESLETQVRNIDINTSTWQKDENSKHVSVLSKFAQSRDKASQTRSSMANGDPWLLRGHSGAEDVELHGLEPIPQPEEVETIVDRPSYSTLPPWLANPTVVRIESEATFESLGLSSEAVAILKENGLKRPFPIQTAVIPLLSAGPRRHHGDLCISAVTGSGKTLGYVLPMIETLKPYVTTKLRGLIVVPTRELVKQVRATCDMFAAGSNLKIATALGSQSLVDEQDMLIEVDFVFDPKAYKQEQERPIEWSTFSMDKVFDRALEDDELECLDRVRRYSSKIDILICTPGRLVDHLRTTPGFSLDNVTWVVIDEADRLLNESYQEWVEVVMPALESRKATEARDAILEHLRLDVPPRQITKIALSATMTSDISKLNTLNLQNPKMIVLGKDTRHPGLENDRAIDLDDDPVPDSGRSFTLPRTLIESAISVEDEAEKPLFLLELLRSRIRPAIAKKVKVADLELSISDSNSSSTSQDSDTPDSDSDSGVSNSSGSYKAPSSSPLISDSIKPAISNPNKIPRALIFTRSSEAAVRLSRLLSLIDTSLATNITTLTRSSSSSASSRKAMQSFRMGKTSILIATDRASRGLDVPDLEHVISYDVPASASIYVHRVGRTARAGNPGHAWTLLVHREARWFWTEIGKGVGLRRSGKVNRIAISVEDNVLKGRYEEALKKLGEEVRGI